MNLKMRKKTGFTLIELLVVISIIGLLAAILMPVLSRAKKAGLSVQCKSNLKQIGYALDIYLQNNNQYLPFVAKLPGDPAENPGHLPSISTVLAPYANVDVFQCPADNKGYFKVHQTSYEWLEIVNGMKVLGGKIIGTQFEALPPTSMSILFDFESFHGPEGAPKARNFLFLDGHVDSM